MCDTTKPSISFKIDYDTLCNNGYGSEVELCVMVNNRCVTKNKDHTNDKIYDTITVYVEEFVDWLQWLLDDYGYKDMYPLSEEEAKHMLGKNSTTDYSDFDPEWYSDGNGWTKAWEFEHSMDIMGHGIIWPNVQIYKSSIPDNVCIKVSPRKYSGKTNPYMTYLETGFTAHILEQDFVTAVQKVIDEYNTHMSLKGIENEVK